MKAILPPLFCALLVTCLLGCEQRPLITKTPLAPIVGKRQLPAATSPSDKARGPDQTVPSEPSLTELGGHTDTGETVTTPSVAHPVPSPATVVRKRWYEKLFPWWDRVF